MVISAVVSGVGDGNLGREGGRQETKFLGDCIWLPAGDELVLVGDWSSGGRLGGERKKGGALVCIIWIGIGGGLGRSTGVRVVKNWGEGKLGRGEHGFLGIGPLGILMLGAGGGPETPPGLWAHGEGRTGLRMVVAVVIGGDTHLVEVALVTQTSLVFGAEF